jgi:hypothetical protein
MARISRITKKLITATVSNDDLNDALFDFQNAIGIKSGDVAGQVFSGGWNEEWKGASLERRREMMSHYIAVESIR